LTPCRTAGRTTPARSTRRTHSPTPSASKSSACTNSRSRRTNACSSATGSLVEPPSERDAVTAARRVGFDDISSAARSELEYAVEELLEADEERFVEFYNEAQPITLRLHQLNLLPGIGKKLRNDLLDERKREPFDTFEEIEERVSGLHNPREVLVERIIEELREEDLKYRIFVRGDEHAA